jgi:hypothetical protein
LQYKYITRQHVSQRKNTLQGGKMKNIDIRNAAGGCGVKLWQVAEAIGMNESAFSRKLRKELPLEEKQRIMEAIDRLVQETQGVS